MRRIGLIFVSGAALLGLAASLRAQEQVQLLPPLPPEEVIAAFAPDAGRSETAAACGMCHAPAMVTGKHFTAEKWAEVVDQMTDKGAKVRDQDYDTIVDYLARNYGTGQLATKVIASRMESSGDPAITAK